MSPIGPNHLEGDGDAQLGIPRLIDGAHSADAEDLEDVVARAERLPDLERTRGGRDSGSEVCRSRFAGAARGSRRPARASKPIQPGGRAERAVRGKTGSADRDDGPPT